MAEFPKDIYTEPPGLDFNTLRNLGPLAGMAGIWTGQRGLDVKPKAEGAKKQAYVERYELQPIDPQTNGPQLFYGLRYHQHVVKPEHVKTYHDQVGFELLATRGQETYYDEDTVLLIKGQPEPFHHTDRNTLTRIGEPTPNPMAQR